MGTQLGIYSFDDAVADVKAKAEQFANLYRTFMSGEPIAAQNQQLYSQWKSVASKVSAIKSSVSWVTNLFDSAGTLISNTFGLSGVQGLGLIPIVPIAALVAASAALVYGINLMSETVASISEFKQRTDVVAQMNAQRAAQGLPPLSSSDVANIINKPSQAQTILTWGLVAAAAYFILPKLLDKIKT